MPEQKKPFDLSKADISLKGATRNDMLDFLHDIPGGYGSLLVTIGIIPRFPLESTQWMNERTVMRNLRGLYEQLNKQRERSGLAPLFTENPSMTGAPSYATDFFPAPDALASSPKVVDAVNEFLASCTDDYLKMLCQTELFYLSKGRLASERVEFPSMEFFSDIDIQYRYDNTIPHIDFRYHDGEGKEVRMIDTPKVCTLVIPSWNPYPKTDWWDNNKVEPGHSGDFFADIFQNGAVVLYNQDYGLDQRQYEVGRMFRLDENGIELPRFQCVDVSCFKSVGYGVYLQKPLFVQVISSFLSRNPGVPRRGGDRNVTVPKDTFLQECGIDRYETPAKTPLEYSEYRRQLAAKDVEKRQKASESGRTPQAVRETAGPKIK